MPKKKIEVEVEGSGYDLGQAIAKAVAAAKQAKASGVPVPAQIAADLMAVVGAFAPVAGELSEIGADIAESREEFVKGLNIAAYDIYAAALG